MNTRSIALIALWCFILGILSAVSLGMCLFYELDTLYLPASLLTVGCFIAAFLMREQAAIQKNKEDIAIEIAKNNVQREVKRLEDHPALQDD